MKRSRIDLKKILLIILFIFLAMYLFRMFFSRPTVVDDDDYDDDDDIIDVVDDDEDDDRQDYQDYEAYNQYVSSNPYSNSYSNNWQVNDNTGNLNTSVLPGVRKKRTKIIGNNKDTVTIMVYMCGADLEANNAMGSYDLSEMASARFSDNVNMIVYTGGTTKWHVADISTRYNQIYKVLGNNEIDLLVENAGTGSMVDPNTLVDFIEYCEENFEANRYELIFWDHGGGSVSGYGYDLKYPNRGSMGLDQIDAALTEAGVEFDFIGFDACLMANTETALMLSEHADYLIGSEEAEPGIGWYYTDWLNALNKNTSMPTIEIGKNIADSFISKCRQDVPGQTATLAVIDLAEVQDNVSKKFKAFASSTNNLINNGQYKTVSNARGGAREFAQSTGVDLVDLVDVARRIGSDESKALVDSILSAVKYNRTSSDISNAYGLSVFFPYRSTQYVNTVLNTYKNINIDAEYINCVRSMAQYSGAGQISSGGSHYGYNSYNSYDYDSYYSNQGSSDLILNVLDLFINGSYSDNSSYDSYYGSGLDLLFGRSIDPNMAKYIAENHFDADLAFKDGKITFTDKQLELIDTIKLNVVIDDGKGYIDLGKDNIYEIKDNNLLAVKDLTWMAASIDNQNWQVVPFYFISDTVNKDGVITTGRIPVLLNGQLADLLVTIDDEGIEVVGVTYSYKDETDTIAKNIEALKENDEIEFVCDYYTYDGEYVDSYKLNDKLVIKDKLYLGDVDISKYKHIAQYEIKDIYQQSYFTTNMD